MNLRPSRLPQSLRSFAMTCFESQGAFDHPTGDPCDQSRGSPHRGRLHKPIRRTAPAPLFVGRRSRRHVGMNADLHVEQGSCNKKASSRGDLWSTWRSRAFINHLPSRLPQSLRDFAMTCFESQGAFDHPTGDPYVQSRGSPHRGRITKKIAEGARLLQARRAIQVLSSFTRRRRPMAPGASAFSAFLCVLCVRF